MENRDKINRYFEDTLKENWERLALTDFNGVSNQYKDVARKIAKLHLLYEHIGIRPGDKIALCGRNSASWAIVFFSALTYGAVVRHQNMRHPTVNVIADICFRWIPVKPLYKSGFSL